MKKVIKKIFAKLGYEIVAASYFQALQAQADANKNPQPTQSEKQDHNNLSASESADLFNQAIADYIKPFHETIFWGDRMLTLDKSLGFWKDKKFKQAFEAIKGSHNYDQYGGNDTVSWRVYILVWAARNALKLEGDFVECGVFKGDFSWVITQATDFLTSSKDFYLYDTFEGLSEKYSSPDDFPDNPGYWQVAQEAYSVPGIYESVCKRFFDIKQVKIIKGTVPDSFKEECPENISFLHIDLNSPKAEVGALELLFDKVVPGGIIVLDDYGWEVFHKQKEAEDLFMAERGHEILELPTGQGLIIKMRDY